MNGIACKTILKVGIIDEGIDTSILDDLVPYSYTPPSVFLCESCYNFYKDRHGLPFSHGTLCTALFIEALYNLHIMEDVKLIDLPITTAEGEKPLKNLLNALEFCANHNFDIISMSVGIKHLAYAKQMLTVLQRLDKSIIVAAAANDFGLTYPAAFSEVIGVKRSGYARTVLEIVDFPSDGIEVVLPYRETDVLQKLREKYSLDYRSSNSILTPQISALIAKELLLANSCKGDLKSKQNVQRLAKNKSVQRTIPSKNTVLEMLKHLPGTYTHQGTFICSGQKSEASEIPVVLIEYGDMDYHHKKNFTAAMQKEFEILGYSCYVLHDLLDHCVFENGWYKVIISRLSNYVQYYQNLVSDGVILLLINRMAHKKCYADYLACDRVLIEAPSASDVMEEIAMIQRFFMHGENL